MARIVIDARIIRSSTGRYIERLLSYLQQLDQKNNYSVLLRPADLDFWQPSAKNFSVVEAPFEDFSLQEQIGLNILLRGLQPDLVHFTMPQFPILYSGSFVSTIHDLTMLDFAHGKWYELLYALKLAVFRRVFRSAVKRAERIITPTNFIKGQLLDRFHVWPDKIAVTLAAADRLGDRKKPKLPAPNSQLLKSLAKQKFFLYVGQAKPYKNLRRLIEAFALLEHSSPDLKLVIAGKNTHWHEPLQKLVSRLGMDDVVIFTGFIDDGQLSWLYKNAEALVFPSLSEGFGLPGLEAMIYGCPVLASGNSCMPEVYGDAALYFDPYSVDDMAIIMERVLSDDKLRNKLAKAGPRRARQFSWRRMAEQTLDVYQKALGS